MPSLVVLPDWFSRVQRHHWPPLHAQYEAPVTTLTTRQSTKTHPPSDYCTFPAASWKTALHEETTGCRTDAPRQHRSPDAHTCWISLLPVRPEISSAVVSAIQADVSKHFYRRTPVIHVPIKDIPNAELLVGFDRVVELIARVLDGNENRKVLVCHQVRGVSRFWPGTPRSIDITFCAPHVCVSGGYNLYAPSRRMNMGKHFPKSGALAPACDMAAPFGAREKMEGQKRAVDPPRSWRRVGN